MYPVDNKLMNKLIEAVIRSGLLSTVDEVGTLKSLIESQNIIGKRPILTESHLASAVDSYVRGNNNSEMLAFVIQNVPDDENISKIWGRRISQLDQLTRELPNRGRELATARTLVVAAMAAPARLENGLPGGPARADVGAERPEIRG